MTEPTRFEMEGIGSLEVRRAEAPWGEDASRYRELRERMAALLEAAGCRTVTDFQQAAQRRAASEVALRDSESRLRELRLEARAADAASGRVRLRQLVGEIAELRAKAPQALLPGIENWVADQT